MGDEEDAEEVDEHADFLPDAVLQLVQVVRHPAGKVCRRRRVVPADVLPQHSLNVLWCKGTVQGDFLYFKLNSCLCFFLNICDET